MATFTIRLRDIVKMGIDLGLTKDDYPIFREQLRGWCDAENRWQYTKVDTQDGGQEFYGLNRKILDHYAYREIGQESIDMFIYMLNEKMRLIMPYYNQLLMSESKEFDPFQTQDSTHVSTSTSENDANGKARTVSGNTPQVALSGNADYASAFTDSNSQSGGTTTSDNSVHVTGSQGHTAALLMQWRRSFLNIEASIVNELDNLFMQITDTQDSMYERNDRGLFTRSAFWPYF